MGKVLAKPSEAMYNEFKEKAGILSAEVYRTANMDEARKTVAQIIGELGAKKVVFAPSELVNEVDLSTIGKNANIEVTSENLRKNAADADLGISQLDYAVAEIGALVGNSDSIESRMVSILPPIHMVLLRTGNILPNLLEAINLYNNNLGELPRYLTFVSGPSRTSDIERVLTIGVHGPGRLIIIFID